MERKGIIKGVVCVMMVFFLTVNSSTVRAETQNIENDIFWHDTDGNPIYSQGGGIFTFEDPETGVEKYYWYGVHYEEAEQYYENPTQKYDKSNIMDNVTCYSSDDLVNWKFENNILTKEDIGIPREDSVSPWAGRLGVAYVKELDVYALFIQWRNNDDERGVLVATGDSPTGAFTWDRLLDMRKFGCATINSGDQTVFTDDDGTSYLVYSKSSGRNKIYVSKIGAKDGQVTLTETKEVYSGTGREGNCMFKYKGKYYICASDLYGWNASHAYYMYSDNPMGPYTPLNNMALMPGCVEDYCHGTQTGFFFTIKGTEQETVVFCGDRWAEFAANGLGYNQWCPMSFEGEVPYFNSLSSWDFDLDTGEWHVAENNNYVKNGSFDADRIAVTEISGWSNSISKGNTPIKNSSNVTTGKYGLALTDTVDFTCQVMQEIESSPYVAVPDGEYDLTAQVKYNNKFKDLQMCAVSGGLTTGYKLTASAENWTEIVLENVSVSGGRVEIGFKADGMAGAYCYIDDITLVSAQKSTETGGVSGNIVSDVLGKTAVIEMQSDNFAYTYEVSMNAEQTSFSLAGIKPGNYVISASAAGGVTQEEAQEITVTNEGIVSGLTFNITVNTGTVSGNVVDEQGNPLAGVGVKLNSSSDEHSTESDQEGKYYFEDISAGTYEIAFEKKAYKSPEAFSIIVEKGVEYPVEQVVMQLNSGDVTGIVTDGTGNPIADAQVILRDSSAKSATAKYSTTTDAEGKYKFEAITEGAYQLLASTASSSVSGVLQNVEIGKAGLTTANIEIPEAIAVVNGDFEQALSVGWTNDHTYSSYGCYITSRSNEVYKGSGTLAYYRTSAYVGNTYQTLENVKNGTYVINVMVRGGAPDNDEFYIYAKNANGEVIAQESVPKNTAYEMIGLQVEVTDETLTFGVYGNLSAGSWGRLDNFRAGILLSTVKNEGEIDKTSLDALLKSIDELDLKSEDFPEEDWETFTMLKTEAEALLANEEAEQEAVNQMVESLKSGLEALQDSANAAAEAVIALINVIGEVEDSEACAEKIAAAEAAYAELSEAQKQLVTNFEVLTDAKKAYDAIQKEKEEATANQEAADVVIALINEIGEVEDSEACAEKIVAAEAAYAELSEAQKQLVTNYEALTSAKEEYEAIQEGNATEAANKEAAASVIALINSIGKVEDTANSSKKIQAAREGYYKLSDVQKALVTNYDILTKAEAEYEAIQKEKQQETEKPIETEKPDVTEQKVDVKSLVVATIRTQKHNGKALTPKLVIKRGSKTLTEGKDYSLSYKNNILPGTATVTINGKNSYTGSTSKNFIIVAAKGKTYTVGKFKYKVTAASTKSGEVTLTNPVKKSLKSVIVPATVKIGNYKYKVTQIGASAFKNNKKLTSVKVGNNVQKIGANAFAGSKKLKKITISSKVLKNVGNNAFKNIYKKAVIKVPSSKLSKYKSLLKNKGQSLGVKIKK